MQHFKAELYGRDLIEVKYDDDGRFLSGSVNACMDITRRMAQLRKSFGPDVKLWPVPNGTDHGSMLIREIILKSCGKWDSPYKHDEICHCRTVPTKNVEACIVAGAHSISHVMKETLAGTGCGTCRPELQKVLDFRLGTQVTGESTSSRS